MISVDHQWAYLQHDDISVGSGNVNLTTTLNVVTYCSINQIARKQVCFFYVPSMISGCTFKDNFSSTSTSPERLPYPANESVDNAGTSMLRPSTFTI